MSLSLNVVLII